MALFLKRKYSAAVIILLAGILLVSYVTMSSALSASDPTITINSPADGVTLAATNVNISINVSDSDDNIQNGNFYLKLNGVTLPATLRYKGYFVSDNCGNSSYVVSSYKDATISAPVSGLPDGVQTVEAQVVDQAGNITVKTWHFTIAVKPVISEMSPANGSITVNNTGFSFKVGDNTQIDPGSIQVALDAPVNLVVYSYDDSTGLVTYQTPGAPLLDGLHTVYVSVKDKAGNLAKTSWTYTVMTSGPQVGFTDAGKTLATDAPTLTVTVKSGIPLAGSASASIDAKPAAANFTFKGHWTYPPYQDPVWAVDSANEATITIPASGLTDGSHTLAVQIKDQNGNMIPGQWNFQVVTAPEFSQAAPADGSAVKQSAGFSVMATDNDGLNASSLNVKLDGTPVQASFDQASGLIAYQPVGGLPEGSHKVEINIADTAGTFGGCSWSFAVQTTGPALTFAQDGQSFDTAKPPLTVAVKSAANISTTGTVMKLDGQTVPAALSFSGHWTYPPYQDPVWVTDTAAEGTLTYTPPAALGNGTHTLTVDSADTLGNTSSKTWTFKIAQKPVISGLEPADGANVTTAAPTIKAVVTPAAGDTLDQASVRLTVDGQDVTPTVTAADNGALNVSYASTALNTDAYHNLSITAASASGLQATAGSKFYVNTKGDMPVDIQSCGLCHKLNQYDKYVHTTKGPYGYDDTTFVHKQGTNCAHCHSDYTPQFCGYCHGGDPGAILNGLANADPTLDQGQNCTLCHTANDNVIGGTKPSTDGVQHQVNLGLGTPALGSNNMLAHDLMPLHTVDKPGCVKCHSQYLTREHNRVTKAGVQLTCATCHASTRPEVQAAVADKNTDCSACHAMAGHDAQHASGLDDKCLTCHASTLMQDHLSNPKTTGGRNYTCDTCHSSTNEAVKLAIATGNKSCGACHQKAHSLPLAGNTPPDLPLYSGFQWSNPLDASLFTGEAATPAGYTSGYVILSNRRSDISPEEVWSFYQSRLTAQGWVLKSGAPAAGADYFAAEFSNGEFLLTVRCYHTNLGNNSGGDAGGYRLDLWYK